MEKSKEEMEKNKQIVQLVSDMATIRISDVKEKGKQFRNREKELMSNKIKVMEKIEDRLQHVEEEAIQEVSLILHYL